MSLPNRNNRILIIDDNPSIHADFEKILCPDSDSHAAIMEEAAALFDQVVSTPRGQSFEIHSAYQGEEGLRMANAANAEGLPFAMAFVDVRMPPGWDGVETIKRIWEVCPELQVVICTAYSDHSWAEIIAQLGAADNLLILKKPFDDVEVLQLAHALTERWTLRKELRGRLFDSETLVRARTADLEKANAELRNEVSERENAQKALLLSEERFSKAFRSSPLPIFLHALKNGRFLEANESFFAMTGYKPEDLASLSVGDLHLAHAISRGEFEPVRGASGTIRDKFGAQHDVLISTEVITICDEPHIVTTLLDVTDQRLLEKKLKRAQKLESLGQLAAGIAHNFNNILGVILGHASLHLQTSNEAGTRQSFEEIAEAAERGAKLVRQLLAAGKQQRKEDEALDVNALLVRTKHLLSPILGRHIQLNCELSDAIPNVIADQSNLEQVVLNLVINARDAMPNGGTIILETKRVLVEAAHVAAQPHARAGEHVKISVTDNGCGMSPATLERIFEPFFTTKGPGLGTGLGLATVHGIVAQHGGRLEVTSQVGAGSRFDVFLPAGPSRVVTKVPAALRPSATTSGKTILLVEDEPGLRRIVQYTLENSGYRVLVAKDGQNALSIWSENGDEVDLVLTDLMMPGGLNGFDLADRLRQSRPNLPIIFSTGYAPERAARLDRYEQATFLQKPYTADCVLSAVCASLSTAAEVQSKFTS